MTTPTASRASQGERSELPLVSIITPSLRQGQFIEEAILSVKKQSYPNIEHIVIDGGSTDNTLAVLTRYQGSYNMRWLSKPDRGMYDGINHGLAMARGEIIAYLNTDDVYLPWTVETVAAYFTAHPEIDLVFGDQFLLDMDGRVSLQFQPPFRSSLLRSGWSPLPQPTVFWRSKVYEALGGFDHSLQFAGDWDYWVKAAERFRFGQIRELLAMSRIHEEAKNVAGRLEMAQEFDRIILRYAQRNKLSSYPNFIRLKLYIHFWRRWSMARFLLLYSRSKAGRRPSPWQHFLGLENITLAPWHQLLLGFLRLGQRSRQRWTMAGTFQWSPDGLRVHGNNNKPPSQP